MEEIDERDIIVEKYKRGRDKVITLLYQLLSHFVYNYFIQLFLAIRQRDR